MAYIVGPEDIVVWVSRPPAEWLGKAHLRAADRR